MSGNILEQFNSYIDVVDELNSEITELNSNLGDTGDVTAGLSKTFENISDIGSALADAFMDVDENVARVIGSASTLAGGGSGIFDAFKGEEVDGLGLMSGIQGAAAGLGGVLGLDSSSDEGQLVSGLGGVGAGIAGLLSENPLEGIQSLISSLPSLIDGIFESWDEGFYKQFEAMGFDDQFTPILQR